MAQEKSMKLNKTRSQEFVKALEAKPSDKATFIYQAVIVSLILHVFILFITQMLTQDNRMAKEDVELMPLDMDMTEEIPEEIQQQEDQQQNPRTGELKNLIANENSQRTSEERSYRGMSKDQINEQVYNDLKNMEAEEFAKLNEGRPDYTVAQKEKGSSEKNTGKKPSDYDWYKNKPSNTSYSGNVSAAYNMKGRDAMDNPVPTYRCKIQGQVVILVTINNLGQVTDARVDEGKSSADDCLRTESEKYARKWKFNSGAEKKQDGTITFTFSAQ